LKLFAKIEAEWAASFVARHSFTSIHALSITHQKEAPAEARGFKGFP